jgi:hypothetical protein
MIPLIAKINEFPMMLWSTQMLLPGKHSSSGSIQAFIIFLGFNILTFDNLVTKFEPYFNTLSPHTTSNYTKSMIGHQQIIGGASHMIDAKTRVALCLSNYRTRRVHYTFYKVGLD